MSIRRKCMCCRRMSGSRQQHLSQKRNFILFHSMTVAPAADLNHSIPHTCWMKHFMRNGKKNNVFIWICRASRYRSNEFSLKTNRQGISIRVFLLVNIYAQSILRSCTQERFFLSNFAIFCVWWVLLFHFAIHMITFFVGGWNRSLRCGYLFKRVVSWSSEYGQKRR